MAEVKGSFKDGTLTVYVEGKIDSVNAAQFEADIKNIRSEYPDGGMVMDIENLEYTSSAGLRVFLRTAKSEKNFKVINASAEVYEIFDMTGFSEIMDISKAYRKFSVEGCKVIGKGAKGTVYRLDGDTIIKVYNDPESLPSIKRERELAREAFVLGVPTAIPYDVVKVGDSYGSVFELLNAEAFSDLMKSDAGNFDKYVYIYADLLKQIHDTKVRPGIMPDIKILINKWLEQCKSVLEPADYEKLVKLVDETPDTDNMLHGDYHTNNIMMQNGEALIIDMDTLSHGHPVFELASVYITYVGFGEVDKSNVEGFIGLPYEKAKEIWTLFLPRYLGTDDPAKIADVEEKTRLMAMVRLMRHYLRRGAMDTEEGRKIIEYSKNAIHELLQKIDTLVF